MLDPATGGYRLYADVVHAAGFPETIVGSMTLPQISGRPLKIVAEALIATLGLDPD